LNVNPSFLEIPQITFDGRDVPSIYINTADIVSVAADYDGGTVLQVRDLGSEGMTARFKTFLPINSILDVLGELARWPGVRSWSPETKAAFGEPAKERAQAAREAEKAYERR
jgi:hypothetical protein